MKTELLLDHATILANQARPIHFALRFTADAIQTQDRKPAAFCVVLDRSGSMSGDPLRHALQATRTAIKNLRKTDHFALVVFDNEANVVIPLQPGDAKAGWDMAVNGIQPGGSTNLTGGWMLGRDELGKAPAECSRRVLLLTDGLLNQGIVDPAQVKGIVASGLERNGIRTSCLGFGDDYDENLLSTLAQATHGEFYDAVSPEKLPAIFAHELDGLQGLSVQNLRVRLKRLDFCETIFGLNEYPFVLLPDGRIEVAIGDLVSEEERVAVFALEVLPLPLIHGQPVADLAGESLLEVELAWDEISSEGITSQTWSQIVRVQATQNPEEVKADQTVLSWVAVQRAAKAIREATEKAQQGDEAGARRCLETAAQTLIREDGGPATRDALESLQKARQTLDESVSMARKSKSLRFMNYEVRKSSSRKQEPPHGKP